MNPRTIRVFPEKAHLREQRLGLELSDPVILQGVGGCTDPVESSPPVSRQPTVSAALDCYTKYYFSLGFSIHISCGEYRNPKTRCAQVTVAGKGRRYLLGRTAGVN